MATREELAFALATLMEGVKEHDLSDMLGLDRASCQRLYEIGYQAKMELFGKPKDYFNLKPNYSGYFEVFWFEARRYGRFKDDQGAWYSWYVWEEESDSFKCLDNEGSSDMDLPKKLESLYQNWVLSTWD